jgi:hypothetical protein
MTISWNLNPFQHLKEHNNHPFARFFRTTLWQKCFDTFVTFIGKQQLSLEIETIGIFDYLSLGLSLLLHQLFLWSYKNYKNDFQALVIFIPCALLNICAWCVKLITSAILTICCLPIILICHKLSLITGGSHLKNKAFDILGNDLSSTNNALESIKFSDFLTRHERCLHNMEMKLSIIEPTINNKFVNNISSFSEKITSFLLFKKSTNMEPKTLQAQSKLTFTYYYPEEKGSLSNFSFFFSSIFLVSIFPWLAAFSAKSMTTSATERLTKAITGIPKDLFEVIIDMDNQLQQQQLSAFFKLNVSSVLNDLYKTSKVDSNVNASAIEIENQRLVSLIN